MMLHQIVTAVQERRLQQATWLKNLIFKGVTLEGQSSSVFTKKVIGIALKMKTLEFSQMLPFKTNTVDETGSWP